MPEQSAIVPLEVKTEERNLLLHHLTENGYYESRFAGAAAPDDLRVLP